MIDQSVRQVVIDTLYKVTSSEQADWLRDPSNDMAISDLGIDSLDGIEWCMEIETLIDVELDPAELITVGSVDGLVKLVADRQRRGERADETPQLVRVPRDAPVPLSPLQGPIWAHSQTAGGHEAHGIHAVQKIVGPLDVAVLRDCLSYIVRRHEVLRTTFVTLDGQPVQVAHPAEAVTLPVFDLSADENPDRAVLEIISSERSQVQDLSRLPLMRFSLIRMSENEHWLVRVCHHIIWDDWSSRVMRKELALLYEAKRDGKSPPLPEFEPLQYADYAAWQLKTFRRGGPAYQKAVVWWKDCFQQPPRSIDLPFVRAAPLVGVDPSEGRIKWPVDVEVAQRLARFARNESTTIFVVWLAALVALLKTETRQSDVVIGTYITARRRAEVQNMMGFFANQLALRFQCTTAMPFRNWLSEVASRVHAAEKHCEIPYAELLGELHTLGTTLAVPLVFTAPLDFGLGDLHFAGLKLTRQQFNVPGPMPWYCNVQLTEYDNLQECRAVFDARIYDPTGVRRFIGRLCDFVDAASWHPDLSIDELLAFSEPGYQAQQSKSQIARENLRA